MTGIEVKYEVIEETLRIEIGHMTELEAEIKMIREDLRGIEVIGDLGIEVDPTVGIKMKTECVITVGSQGIL